MNPKLIKYHSNNTFHFISLGLGGANSSLHYFNLNERVIHDVAVVAAWNFDIGGNYVYAGNFDWTYYETAFNEVSTATNEYVDFSDEFVIPNVVTYGETEIYVRGMISPYLYVLDTSWN